MNRCLDASLLPPPPPPLPRFGFVPRSKLLLAQDDRGREEGRGGRSPGEIKSAADECESRDFGARRSGQMREGG